MRRALLIAALALISVCWAQPVAVAQESEDTVKATFFYRFASFVTWPDGTFSNAESPVILCVIGSDPFAAVVQRVVADQEAGGRTFEVQRSDESAAAFECHALYVVGNQVSDTLRSVRGAPVLTFTDGAVGGRWRGVVHFVLVDDRVRFHIDDALAAEGGMAISSRLLSLAISVRQRSR